MTSKISFLKLMQEDAKRRNWMLVFLSVLFFVCYPVLMMIALDAQTTVNDIWRNRVAVDLLAPGNIAMALVVTAAAAMIAAAEFSYVHSKEKMDLYYSIPVRRKKCSGTSAFPFLQKKRSALSDKTVRAKQRFQSCSLVCITILTAQ